MSTLIGWYLFLVAAVLIVVVIRQHLSGKVELVSVRNAAIGGYIVFQCTSPALALITGDFGRRPPGDPTRAGLEFAFLSTVFLIIIFWAYDKGWVVKTLANKMPRPRAIPGATTMLALAVAGTLVALPLRLGVKIPLVSSLTNYIGTGMSAVACGAVGWVWGRRLLNPALILFSLAIVAVNGLAVMSGSFGRRGLVAVGGAILWGMYYSSWRYLGLGAQMRRLALVGAGPVIFIAAFTSVRVSGEKRNALDHLAEIASGARLGEGLMRLLGGQSCGSVSMWLIETHPDDFAHRHLMTIRFFLVYPVPRDLWPNKPQPMSVEWVSMASLTNVGEGMNVGPGIIGHAASEGGFYALVVYAIVGGLFLRFFDETANVRWWSPMLVLPMGADLGNVLGLARGETSAFAFLTCVTVGGGLMLTLTSAKLLEWTGMTGGDIDLLLEEEPEDEEEGDDDDETGGDVPPDYTGWADDRDLGPLVDPRDVYTY
jgi:hypothetical protein